MRHAKFTTAMKYVHDERPLVSVVNQLPALTGASLKEVRWTPSDGRARAQGRVIVIAHKIWIAAYHLLATREDYRELGEGYLDTNDKQRTAHAAAGEASGRLGYQVTLQERESSREARDGSAHGVAS